MRKIISDPNFMHGKPYLGGVRISVEMVLEELANKKTIHEIVRKFPQLTEDDVVFIIRHAMKMVNQFPDASDIVREAR